MSNKFFNGIKGKVMICFFSIILLFCVYGIISTYLVTQSKNATIEINSVNQPCIISLSELELMFIEVKGLISNWVESDTNQSAEKARLIEIHEKEYPEIKTKISELQEKLNNKNLADSLKGIVLAVDKNFALQKEIMDALAKPENYLDSALKAESATKSAQVISEISNNQKSLNKVLDELKNTTSSKQVAMIGSMEFLSGTNMILLVIIMGLGLFLTLRLSNHLIKPIHSLRELVDKVSKGELDNGNVNVQVSKDEIGEMMESVQRMIEGLKVTAKFADEIGKGNLETDYNSNSEKDVLGNALITMRDNLIKVSKEDRQRNWANEGYAKFGEILRSQHDTMEQMLDIFLAKMVKYINANQGWLYVVSDKIEGEEQYMNLMSVYAFDRKKFIEKQILKGEGLAGQAWIEGETIILTEVPSNYVHITSGLGDSTPRCILIVPLKVNENINGVIEFASFHEFQPYEIEFVEKLGESLSSTLSSIEINQKTKTLLEESQKQKNQMHEQEEELRQNLEELQATQEEMIRKQQESEELIERLRESEENLTRENLALTGELKLLKDQ